MNPVESAILDLLSTGQSSMRPLVTRFARASVYAALKKLREGGRVVPGEGAGVWRLPDPVASPPACPPSTMNWPSLSIPHVKLMPSTEHKAVAELVLLSRLVRLTYERHHASYVLFSTKGLRGKSFLMTASALMLGTVPEQVIVNAGAETRGSLGIRRRANGEVVQIRNLLSGALLGVDEARRGRPELRQVIELLISGSRTVPLEDGALEVLAVVMLALNSPEGAATIEDQTGLDEPMQRRCGLVRLDDIVLEPAFATDGEERLERLRAIGPVPLPDPASKDGEEALGREIARLLPVVLEPDHLGQIDNVLVRQQAVAATWIGLSPPDAVALVMKNWGVIWATTGWTKATWEESLVEALGRRAAPVLVEEEPLPVVIDAVSSELDYGTRVARLDEVARAHGAGDPEELGRRLELAEAVRDAGLRRADLDGLRRLLRIVRGTGEEVEERLRVLIDMDAAGVGAGEARSAIAVVAGGEPLGLDGGDVVQIVRGIEDAGLVPAEVGAWASQVMIELGAIDQQIEVAQAELRRWSERVFERATDLATANARIEKLNDIIKDVKKSPTLAKAFTLAESEREREVVDLIFREAAVIARAQAV